MEAAELSKLLLYRNAYTPLLHALIRESIRSSNKDLLFYNPDPSGSKYYQDYRDGLRNSEAKINEYHQKISKRIFANYIKKTEDLDSELFCKYVNNYKTEKNRSKFFTNPYRLL
jgi:hypothetical protein